MRRGGLGRMGRSRKLMEQSRYQTGRARGGVVRRRAVGAVMRLELGGELREGVADILEWLAFGYLCLSVS